MKNNVCPKATVIRRPNFSENRICPKIHRMVGSVDWIHDMIIVKWREVTAIFNFSESRICPNIYRMFRSVDWTHDIIIVKWHLFIYSFDTSANFALWQMRHRFNPRIRVNDYQRYSMLTVLRSGLCLVPSAIHLRSKLQETIIFAGITIHKKDILKNFLCIWWWQMLWWKHVLTRKL